MLILTHSTLFEIHLDFSTTRSFLDDINIPTASSAVGNLHTIYNSMPILENIKKETGSPVNCFYLFSRLLFFFMLPVVLWRLPLTLFSVRNDQTNPVWVSILFPYISYSLNAGCQWFVYTSSLSSTLQDETNTFWATLFLRSPFFFFHLTVYTNIEAGSV